MTKKVNFGLSKDEQLGDVRSKLTLLQLRILRWCLELLVMKPRDASGPEWLGSSWVAITRAVHDLRGIFQSELETPSDTHEAGRNTCRVGLAAISVTIGFGPGTHREASQKREAGMAGGQPVSTGMPRSPSRAWLMWTEISEIAGPSRVCLPS